MRELETVFRDIAFFDQILALLKLSVEAGDAAWCAEEWG